MKQKRTKCTSGQAARVIAKFGTAGKLAKALQLAGAPADRSQVFRWTRPQSVGGTGGSIPGKRIRDVLRAAREQGILLTSEDLDPR